MANTYNSKPIILTTTMASGWRALQTLNTGNLPANAQQTSGAVTRQWGIQITKVQWSGMTAAGHTFTIVDPNDSTNLLQGQAGTALVDQEYDFESSAGKWRDFKLTHIDSGTLLLWYRS